ncbi:MAG: amidohydrolase family protein [Planctomycetes bacterium]|nr:amidohydrolase family protein [Planctomycetota bacterium]
MSNPTHRSISRRRFHQAISALTITAVAPRVAHAEEDDSQFPPGKFVDVHTHLGQTWNTTTPLGAEELLRWMDAHEVAQAVVLPLVSPEASSYPLTSDYVLAQTAPYRDRLIPFCSIDPRTSYRGGEKGAIEMLRKYKDAGARGFGEHKPGVPIDHPGNLQLFRACGEVGLPILFHLDNQRNTDQPGLPGLAKVLAEVPDAVFIGHGPGWWASISGDATQQDLGGYPRTKTVPGGAIDVLMEKHPNIYGDLSAGSGANAINRDLEFGREFLIRRADRLMFGTDFLSPGQNVPQFELFAKLDLPDEVRRRIFRENARRVLKIG